MNIPTHYNTMTDAEVLRDLFARNYGGDPMLGYVCDRWELLVEGDPPLEYACQRWELLVEGEKDRQEETDKLTAEKEGAEILVDEKQKEIDNATKLLLAMEKDVSHWADKADELQMEVERLSAQLDVCDPFGKMRE